jgi:hypothetical protein
MNRMRLPAAGRAVAAESGQVDHAPKINQISQITQNASPRLIGLGNCLIEKNLSRPKNKSCSDPGV